MDLIKSGSYIDIFYAKQCATTKISTVAGYHVVLATLLFVYSEAIKSKQFSVLNIRSYVHGCFKIFLSLFLPNV